MSGPNRDVHYPWLKQRRKIEQTFRRKDNREIHTEHVGSNCRSRRQRPEEMPGDTVIQLNESHISAAVESAEAQKDKEGWKTESTVL